jgi:hypothetical protein
MPHIKVKKIVYLFGAGATHAELANLYPTLVEKGRGLLISNVSRRVIEKARSIDKYLKDLETVTATSGSLNIELLISLIEQSKIHGWEFKTQKLKDLVREDIESILTESRTDHFYLHKALLEFHRHRMVKPEEKVIGLISLNYDDVLDTAYAEHYGAPNYCFSLEKDPPLSRKPFPLLKLHGSFNWRRQEIRGRPRRIEIIPLGSNKLYLHAPYAFIWSRALEILIECDTLRVIGCSLSQNDTHLIDLLFKAHLERPEAFDIEIIGPEGVGEQIKQNYGFFPKIKTLPEIEGPLFADPYSTNAFKAWLKYKINGMIRGSKKQTKYLKTVVK